MASIENAPRIETPLSETDWSLYGTPNHWHNVYSPSPTDPSKFDLVGVFDLARTVCAYCGSETENFPCRQCGGPRGKMKR